MKKMMTLMLGLSFLAGTVTMFAQDTDKKDDKMASSSTTKKAKKTKKSKKSSDADKSATAPKM